MDIKKDFTHLNFERRIPRLHSRLTALLIAVGIFLLLWWILPIPTVLVILLFIVPILVWVASYGWHNALEQVIRYLERLQMY